MDLDLPETIKKQIKSKPKLIELNFIDKLGLLLDWAKDDEARINYVGIRKLDNGDFSVDMPVLAGHFGIKERSISKNFSNCNYQRCQHQPQKDRVCFTNSKNSYIIVNTYNKVKEELGENELKNWNIDMINNWDGFIKKYPEKKVSDFVIQFGIYKSILSISRLTEYLIQSPNFDANSFQLIFLHFSPMKSFPGKITSFLSSIFSRGWIIGEGPKTVTIVQPYGFLFDDGNQQIMIYNNLKCFYPGLWLCNEDNSKNYDPESLFETFFPREIPSNDNFIDIVINYFPELPEENDDGGMTDQNDDDNDNEGGF